MQQLLVAVSLTTLFSWPGHKSLLGFSLFQNKGDIFTGYHVSFEWNVADFTHKYWHYSIRFIWKGLEILDITTVSGADPGFGQGGAPGPEAESC